MSYQHQDMAAGRWREFQLVEQLAHVGSEVSRALNWQEKGNHQLSYGAFIRALELLDLTIQDPKNRLRLKEPCRVREMLVDYFDGDNTYASSSVEWRKYFHHFALATAALHNR